MRKQIIKAIPGVPFEIGRQGENNARQVQFNIAAWQALYGQGTVELIFQRPDDTAPYPVAVELQDNLVLWTVTDTDTAFVGRYGRAELRYYVGDTLAKSATSAVSVWEAMQAPADVPDPPGQTWLDHVLEVGAQAKAAAQRAENAAIHQPIIQDGTWWIWNPETGIYEDSKTSASGSGGASGAVQYVEQTLTAGQQTQARQNIGAASSEEVSKLSNEKLDKTALPTAVNDALAQAKASGEFDGAPGEDGKDGSPGKDGTSVTHKWNGTVLEITSASGTSSADLKGEPGQDGAQGPAGPAGADGKTPVKGVDYWTQADQTSIVNDVLAALPTWEGGSY